MILSLGDARSDVQLKIAEIRPSRLLGGPLGGPGSGVADEHVATGPTCDHHQPGFGASLGKPSAGSGVAEFVRVESFDARSVGARANLPDARRIRVRGLAVDPVGLLNT